MPVVCIAGDHRRYPPSSTSIYLLGNVARDSKRSKAIIESPSRDRGETEMSCVRDNAKPVRGGSRESYTPRVKLFFGTLWAYSVAPGDPRIQREYPCMES